MANADAAHPSMAQIRAGQDLELNLRRQLAARRFYRRGKAIHFVGGTVSVALALVSPVVLLLAPGLGPALGATAGAWIFLTRLLLEPLKREAQLKGACAQELFDCAVLGIGWNDSLIQPVAEEEIRRASGDMAAVEKVRNWYPAGVDSPWPRGVLVSQRANAVWARRQHRAYARVLTTVALGWGSLGIVVAIGHSAALAQYLVSIALPSLPALLDAVETSRRHSQAGDRRQLVEHHADRLLHLNQVEDRDLREIQDQLFCLRRDGPLVPDWFYKLIRSDYEDDMQYAADRVTKLTDC